jgi:hypothetical protein
MPLKQRGWPQDVEPAITVSVCVERAIRRPEVGFATAVGMTQGDLNVERGGPP